MKLLIFGASGGTGRQLVGRALRQRHDVTAFVRSPADFGMAGAQLAVFTGNVTDKNAVERAMRGQDAVISALGVSRPFKRDPSVVQGIRYILDAMPRHGVRRLVYQSFVGVAESRHRAGLLLRLVGGRLLRDEIADHEEKEGLVRASGLDWTIVRPPKLTNGPATGAVRSGEDIPPRALLPRLSRADVADFILQTIPDPGSYRKSLCVMR